MKKPTPDNFAGLSHTQWDILERAANDECDKQIAVELGISIHTMRWHWDKICQKTGRRSRRAAAMLWAHHVETLNSRSGALNGTAV